MTAALNFKKRYLKRTELVNGDPHVYILFVFLSEQQPRIVADTSVSPFARVLNICRGHKYCVRDTKNVSDFVQKHFVSATNVSQFVQPKKHHGQQCVRKNVSSFTSAFINTRRNNEASASNYERRQIFGLKSLSTQRTR